MTLQELRYLVALADHGHFGNAASACFISQSTLSTQVKKLEDYLGVSLFDRSLTPIAPTSIGTEILIAARLVIAETDHIQQLARHAHEPMSRTIRLGIIPTLGPYYLPQVLKVTQKKFPQLRLLLREQMTPDILSDLTNGQLDAALLALPVADDSLDVMPLFDEPFLAALPAQHALAKRKSIKLSELQNETLLLLEEGHCLRDQALAVCGALQQMEEIRATSLETLRQMVGANIGITLLPALAAFASAPKSTVKIVPFQTPAPNRRIALVWRKRAPLPETFTNLATALRDALPSEVIVTKLTAR
jgi:LysR family transcriptional regulator, hydrogen peroxide-inducible genes activator